MDLPSSECSRLPIPLHTIIRLTPTAYGCEERRFPLPPQISPARQNAPSEVPPASEWPCD
jgi:hypothetical protein